jgi:uncharacterized protein
MHLEDALPDFAWIDQLPGTKVMIKGNHDHWWKSITKLRAALPPSIHVIHNDAITINGVTIGGTRLWENKAINYSPFIDFRETPGIQIKQKGESEEELKNDVAIYDKEFHRLTWSLDAMDRTAPFRVCMVHYPPTGPNHEENQITRLLANQAIDVCLYGHLHNLKAGAPVDYQVGTTKYFCTSCDYLNFSPLLITPPPTP